MSGPTVDVLVYGVSLPPRRSRVPVTVPARPSETDTGERLDLRLPVTHSSSRTLDSSHRVWTLGL